MAREPTHSSHGQGHWIQGLRKATKSHVWGVQTWKPARFGGSKPGNVNVLGGSKPGNLRRPLKRAGFQVWCQKVSRFGPAKTCRFPGLDPPNAQVCRFAGLDPPKRAGFQIWQVSRFGPPKCAGLQVQTCVQISRFGPPKRAGFQVWTANDVWGPNLETCTCWVLNLETCTCWEVQTWKPARLGCPNLETCTFWGVQTSKPARLGGPNLHVWGVQTWKPARFGGSKPGNLQFAWAM